MQAEDVHRHLRLARAEDAEYMLDIYATSIINSVISFEMMVPSVQDFGQRIENTLKTYPWIVLAINDRILGYAYAGPHRAREAYQWSVETTVYVAEEARRTGVARSLYVALLTILRLQGFCCAFAGITLPNPPSVGFHEHLGFKRLGVYEKVGYKMGAWHDVGWWSYALHDVEEPPKPVVPISAFAKSSAFTQLMQNA